jgi:DNA-binding NarL/FixJ family response regulator
MMVAICEKTALFRETLATVVTSRGHHVVCCVSALPDAVRAIEGCTADVLLLDASLTDEDSLAQLRQELGLRVLLLTESGEETSAAAALEAGLADAVIDHAVALVTLERAVNGHQTSAARPKRATGHARHADALLTVREREVIALLLAGRSTDAMAVTLGVSRSTVHSHVQSILRKLGARSRIEAVSIYLGETTQLVG